MDGNSSLDGRVEILKGGVWGTVCDYYFSLLEGTIICRQLGYYGANATYNYAFYPPASNNTPIATSYVFCFGDEVQFGDCYGVQQSWNTQYCSHQDDVGVACISEEAHVILYYVMCYYFCVQNQSLISVDPLGW